MVLLTQWTGLRIGEVVGLRWSDVTTTNRLVRDEIRLLPDMTMGRHARTVFVTAKLKAELHAYAAQATSVDRTCRFFAGQKSIQLWFHANSFAQTLALIYRSVGLEGASSHRTCLSHIDNKGMPYTCSKPLPSTVASAPPLPTSTAGATCSRKR